MSERSKLWNIVEPLIAIVLVSSIIFLILVVTGSPSIQELSDDQSLILVAVTGINVAISGFAMNEARRDREISQKSLKHAYKHSIIQLIEDSLDPTYQCVSDGIDATIPDETYGKMAYRSIDEQTPLPRIVYIEDLDRWHENISNDVLEYKRTVNHYNETREETLEAVEKSLTNEPLSAITVENLDWGNKSVGDAIVMKFSRKLAEHMISGEDLPDSMQFYLKSDQGMERIAAEVRDYHEDRFERLEMSREKVFSKSTTLSAKLIEIREHLKVEHNIVEGEIESEVQLPEPL